MTGRDRMQVQHCADLKATDLPPTSLLELQRDLQLVIASAQGTSDLGEPAQSVSELLERVRYNLDAIHQELAELRDHLPWKPWKTYPPELLEGKLEDNQELVLEMAYELIDIQHFVNNLYLALGLTDEDVQRLYYAKYRENVRRQQEEYRVG